MSRTGSLNTGFRDLPAYTSVEHIARVTNDAIRKQIMHPALLIKNERIVITPRMTEFTFSKVSSIVHDP